MNFVKKRVVGNVLIRCSYYTINLNLNTLLAVTNSQKLMLLS